MNLAAIDAARSIFSLVDLPGTICGSVNSESTRPRLIAGPFWPVWPRMSELHSESNTTSSAAVREECLFVRFRIRLIDQITHRRQNHVDLPLQIPQRLIGSNPRLHGDRKNNRGRTP
jgi:hypothetical protein